MACCMLILAFCQGWYALIGLIKFELGFFVFCLLATIFDLYYAFKFLDSEV